MFSKVFITFKYLLLKCIVVETSRESHLDSKLNSKSDSHDGENDLLESALKKHCWNILWQTPRKSTGLQIASDWLEMYEIKGSPCKFKMSEVYKNITRIGARNYIEAGATQSILMASNELIDNVITHSASGRSLAIFGLIVFSDHVHVYCTTSYSAADAEVMKSRLEQKVSRTDIASNDALRSGAHGRGLLITRLNTDLIYLRQDDSSTEVGFLKFYDTLDTMRKAI